MDKVSQHKNRTHGMSKERPYHIWQDMRKRCNLRTNSAYKNYGGRGISYDTRWDSFIAFWEDMGDSYNEGMTLERENVNGNYCKENCKWIPLEDQARNKRKYSSNTVGVAGVTLFFSRGREYLRARVQDRNTGRRLSKLVNLNLYTEQEALSILEEWLETKRNELGYGETHGS